MGYRLQFLVAASLLSGLVSGADTPPITVFPTDLHGDPLPAGALARMGSVRMRGALASAVLPNGNVVSVDEGRGIRIWELATGKELRRMGELTLAISPHGKLAVGYLPIDPDKADQRLVLQVRDVVSGKEIRRWDVSGDNPSTQFQGPLVLADDGTVATSTNLESSIHVWNVKSDKPVAELALERRSFVRNMVLSADGKYLAFAADDGVFLWKVGAGKPGVLSEVRNSVEALAISPDGKLLAAGIRYANGRKPDQIDVMVWETATGKVLSQLKGHLRGVIALAFSPDSRQLVSGGSDIRFWDPVAGKLLRITEGLPSRWIHALVYAPDGKTVVSSGPTVRLWDASTGREIRPLGGHLDAVNALAVSPDGRIVASTSNDNTICFWDRATGRELGRGEGKTGWSESVEFTLDGKTAITAGEDGVIRVWDAPTGKKLRQLVGHRGPVRSIAVSPGGTMLASAGGERPHEDKNAADFTIHIWDLKAGKELCRFGDHTDPVISLSWSPTGKVIASWSSDGTARLWDVQEGQELRRFSHRINHYAGWLAFSPDGNLLATSMDGLVLWDTSSGRELWRVDPEFYASSASFSPDGSVLALGQGDGNVRLLETHSRQEIALLKGHGSPVKALRFSRDGRSFISGSVDGTLLVWDATRQERPREGTTIELTDASRARLWQELGGPDTGKAHRASWTLALTGQSGVPWLQARVQPVSEMKPERLKRWLGDLDGDNRAALEEATRQLEALGRAAEPFLQEELAKSPSADLSARLKELLSRVQGPPVSSGTLKQLRTVTVLDRLDCPEATAVVERLAQGQPGARVTESARAALLRRRLRQVVDVSPGQGGGKEPTEALSLPRGPERRDGRGELLPPGALVRLGSARWHPADFVTSLHYSPNGKVLVSAGREVCIWEAATGRELHRFGYVNSAMAAIAFSANGELLAHTDEDGTVHLRDLPTAKEIRTFKGAPHRGHALSFSPDGKILAAAGDDDVVRLWDVASGKEIRHMAGAAKSASMVVFSPVGSLLATAGSDETVRLWDPATGKEIRRLEGLESAPVFSPDGKFLAVRAVRDLKNLPDVKNAIHLIDVSTGQVNRRIESAGFHIGFHSDLAFSPDGKLLADVSEKHLRIWETASGLRQLNLPMPNAKDLGAVAFSPDGKVVATAGDDFVIRRWDVTTGKELIGAEDRPGAVSDMVFTSDGKTVVTAGEDKTVRRWDAATGRELGSFPTAAHEHTKVVLSPDGARAASSKRTDGFSVEISLWDVPTGKEIRGVKLPNEVFANRLAFSADGKKLVTLGHQKGINVWNVADGRALGSIKVEDNSMSFFSPLQLSPDGDFLAATAGHNREEVVLWELQSGTPLKRLPGGHFFGPLAFSPDGNNLVAPDDQVRYYELPTGKERCRFRGAWCTAISPDGRLLACSQNDYSISLYALTTGKEIARFAGHRGRLSRLAFSPDGARLASASWDASVLIWDIAAVAGRARPAAFTLTDAQLDDLWQDLADTDATRAYRARNRLFAAPDQTVRYLSSRLTPVARSEDRVAQLIRDLDSEEFAVRERATEQLAGLGDLVKPALRKLLAGQPSPEARRRIEPILAMRERISTPGKARSWRALELLELIGTPEARALLRKLANGAPEALLTRMAQAAVTRLK